MAPETTTEAANANQRPRPLVNRSLPTNSTLLSCPTRRGNLRHLLVVYGSGVKPTATGFDAVERPSKIRASGRLPREARSLTHPQRRAARHPERMPLTKPMSDARGVVENTPPGRDRA